MLEVLPESMEDNMDNASNYLEEYYKLHTFLENKKNSVEMNAEVGKELPVYTNHSWLVRKLLQFSAKIFRRLTNFIRIEQNQVNHELQECIKALMESNDLLLKMNQQQAQQLQEEKEKVKKLIQNIEKEQKVLKNIQLPAMAREISDNKWRISDLLPQEKENIKCRICGYENKIETFQKKTANCRFGGGILERYECPQCGVVFGPKKMFELSPEQLSDDYIVHYIGYSEGDSTEKEEKAFYMLKPEKGKVYLNYGCGCWSKTLQDLNEKGYTVYGYEPYADKSDNPYLLTEKEELENMKFDGIFSNNLLEHIFNPISELIFIKSLLRNKESLMVHSTPCYAYCYEYTRFHAHFYLGHSVEELARQCGLSIVEKVDRLKQEDFMCCVFAIEDEKSYNDSELKIGKDSIVLTSSITKVKFEEKKVNILIKNNSSIQIISAGKYPVYLSYHVYDKEKNIIKEGERTQIVPGIMPEEEQHIELNVDLDDILEKTNMTLGVSLVQEKIMWLHETGIMKELELDIVEAEA